MKYRAELLSLSIGVALQIAMVVAGHQIAPIKALFAVGGMGFSLIAGGLYAFLARAGWANDLVGGTIVGGLCALIGIALSVVLGDVPASLLILGTLSSAVAGAVGGALGRLAFG